MKHGLGSPAPRVIVRAEQLDFDVRRTEFRPRETRVLLADPTHYAVEYSINPHMADHVGSVDSSKARAQWQAVLDAYVALGFGVHVLPPTAGLPDLVFTANQSFPALFPDGRWGAVLSQMGHAERQPEVALLEAWYAERGGVTVPLTEGAGFSAGGSFEGMGDALWLPGHRLIVGGHGFRTDAAVYNQLSTLLEVPVVALELVDERFYHLDTCLSLLDPETALYVPQAFAPEGIALLRAVFPRLLELPLDEARLRFACNGHAPDEQHFLVQAGCPETAALVEGIGYSVIELETSEFLKSGGSVFCMKLMVP